MTTEQRTDPAVSAAIDAWHQACHAGETIEDGMRRVVDAVRAVDTLRPAGAGGVLISPGALTALGRYLHVPSAALVTDEDVQVARAAYLRAGELGEGMRAALEAYGARLLARHGRTT